jgi:hypothetical protein
MFMNKVKALIALIVASLAYTMLGAQKVYADVTCAYNICIDGDFGVSIADPSVSTINENTLLMAALFAVGVVLIVNGKFIKNLLNR